MWEENGMIEDVMLGSHPRITGHKSESTPGVGEGQGSLACCSPRFPRVYIYYFRIGHLICFPILRIFYEVFEKDHSNDDKQKAFVKNL